MEEWKRRVMKRMDDGRGEQKGKKGERERGERTTVVLRRTYSVS